ncbi:MAG TPA: DUF3192 domain-containing protein [Hanamia sp.]
MKPAAILLFALTLTVNNIYAQILPKKPSRTEVGSYNQANLLKIDLGVSKNKVLEVMGGIQKIQTYTTTSFVTKKQSIIINNPFSRDFKTDTAGNTMEILWYYTDVNKADGAITKEQQTPIILEKNAVVGMGWDFYEDYAKRKGITLEAR